MLILPPGHANTVARRALTAREKWMLRGVAVVVAAVALALILSFAIGGKSSRRGCIYATIPGAVGAQEVNQCGEDARQTCLSVRTPGAFTPQAQTTIAAQCRKAGLPVG